jgi:hypothetical protein
LDAKEQILWVAGSFPADVAATRAAWPCRIWPLSARPWAFIRDAKPPPGAAASQSTCVEVEVKIAHEPTVGYRLAPAGEQARTRVRFLGHDAERGASQLAVAHTLRAEGAAGERQTELHLGWLGYRICDEQ